jgi:hypothetical protein
MTRKTGWKGEKQRHAVAKRGMSTTTPAVNPYRGQMHVVTEDGTVYLPSEGIISWLGSVKDKFSYAKDYVLEGFGFNKTEIPVKALTPSDSPSIFQKVKRGKQPHLAQAPTYSLAILWCSVNLGITLIPEYFFYDGIHCGYKWFSRDGSWGEIWKENEDAPSGCLSIEEASEFALLEILKKENGEI